MANQETHSTKEAPAVDLKLTEAALRQIKALMARDKLDGHGLRVAITDGGCSGLSYQLNFEKASQPGDMILNLDSVKVYVDAGSAQHLNGTVIDYVAGLYGGGFKFTNPNATGTCGCGTSFSA
jgi:iron-sulfur cluster assembly protein